MSNAALGFRRRPGAMRGRGRSDRVVLALVARGDADALAELYVRHATLVYAVACRFAGPNQADDITRDVFLHLWATSAASNQPGRPVRLALALRAYQLAQS